MFEPKMMVVPLLFVAQFGLVRWSGHNELRPPAPFPSSFPSAFAGWRRLAVDPASTEQAESLKADALLNWTYFHPRDSSESTVNLFVAWYRSQNEVDAFVHRPEVCLPGNGWNIQSTSTIKIDRPDRAISATKDVISKGTERQVVLYWYQTPQRATADLWQLKFGLALDLLRERRSDVALVRVVTRIDQDTDSATRVAVGFARNAFPFLCSWLPR